jgi:hypothetical protein
MPTAKLTNAELSLILHELLHLRDEGVYWGNREQFYHKRDVLIEKLEQLQGVQKQ